MPKVIRKEVDMAQSHGFGPLGVVISTNAVKTFANNILIAAIGDPYTITHCIPLFCHPMGTAMMGSPDVLVEGIPVHRDGDLIGCGTVADNGSPDVFADSGGGGGSGGSGDGGGLPEGDTIGYVPGVPIVEYLGESIGASGSGGTVLTDIYPWNGVQDEGWTPIHEEEEPSVSSSPGPEVGKNYPSIGISPPNSELPAYWQDPIPLEYESEEPLPPGLSLNSSSGRIYGAADVTGGSVKVRAIHTVWYDEDVDYEGAAGPWWEIPIT